ncbi:MAG: CinA family protein [Marmoricola sp.]|nr:CinA family protein [Marmoricola sp.]
MSSEVAAALHLALVQAGATVGCAESLTGGELAALLSGTPGASATFVGGVVSYATEVKRHVLGVTAERVVTAECAEQMASGVRTLTGVDWALSTTGVAGPDEQEGQRVGTVYVGLAGPRGVKAVRLRLDGDRAAIRRSTCTAALELLLAEVSDG